jgi:hypothetical protein
MVGSAGTLLGRNGEEDAGLCGWIWITNRGGPGFFFEGIVEVLDSSTWQRWHRFDRS